VPGRIVAAWRQGALDVCCPAICWTSWCACCAAEPSPALAARGLADLIDILAIEADIVTLGGVGRQRARRKGSAGLGTFLAAQADYLITGDKDLLVLKDRYAIVRPAEFWHRHGA